MRPNRQDDDGGRETAELAALADGSLAPERRERSRRAVAASPELAERLAEQERAVALARSVAVGRRGAGCLAGAHRSTAACATSVAAARRRFGRCGCRRRAGRRDRGRCARFGQLRRVLPRGAPARRTSRRRASGDATMTKTSSGWRIELRCDGPSSPRCPSLLRGVATKRGRRARSDRDVQRGPRRHALGGRFAEGLPDPHASRASGPTPIRLHRERRCSSARSTRAADPPSVRAAFDPAARR